MAVLGKANITSKKVGPQCINDFATMILSEIICWLSNSFCYEMDSARANSRSMARRICLYSKTRYVGMGEHRRQMSMSPIVFVKL